MGRLDNNLDDFEYEYNPVKENVGGKEAERVIWSTKSIQMAIEGIKKGLPLKANPFIGKNTLLLKPDLVFKRTEEEIEDYIRCKEDSVYFGSKCYLKTTEGLQQCNLRDYQVDYLNHLAENDYSIFLACRQCGKCFFNVMKIVVSLPVNYLDVFNETQCKTISNILKKYFFYIDTTNNYIIEIPVFELFHLYEKPAFINNVRYNLYKIMFALLSMKTK